MLSKKYYAYISIIFLFLVPWYVSPNLRRLGGLSIIFLILLLLPKSYEEAIETKSVWKAVWSLLKMLGFTIFVTLIVLFLLHFFFRMEDFLFPERLDNTLNLEITRQSVEAFLIWNLASVNAVLALFTTFKKGEYNE